MSDEKIKMTINSLNRDYIYFSGEYYGSESSAVKSMIREISPTLFVKSTDLVTCKHPDLAYILHTEESIHPNRKEQHRINSINKR